MVRATSSKPRARFHVNARTCSCIYTFDSINARAFNANADHITAPPSLSTATLDA
jgi:hypothetical protein